MKMSSILKPAIEYAENGFPITELVSYYMESASNNFYKYPNFKETYFINGASPKKGELFKNLDLANTLKIISNEGRKGFYEGEIANIISTFIQEQGGFLSYEDLKNHRSEWVEPVSQTIEVMMFGNSHQMVKELQLFKYLIFLKGLI